MLFLMILLIKLQLANPNTKTFTEGFIGTYQANDLPDPVLKLLSESLITIDSTGRPKPKLIEGWEVNSDATIFKFKLKSNLKWADGSPILAKDLEFNIPDVEVTYLDDRTIQFKLNSSFSPFPTILNRPVFKKGTILLGTGPYKVLEIEKSRIFITKLNLELINRQNLPNLIIRFYPNEKTVQTAFALGEIQAIYGLNEIDNLPSYNKMKVEKKVSYSKIAAIFYNTQDKLLSSRSIRQALSFQTPQIMGVTIADSLFPPNSWAFVKPQKDYLSNKEEANAALERAKSNVPKELLQEEIVLTVTPTLENQGKEIVNAWKELGLKVSLRVESGIPQNFQALLIVQNIPADPDQYSLWHSTQEKTNISKYNSKRADKDLEDGRKALNEEERKEKYADLQKVILEDAPATFLYFPTLNVIFLEKTKPMVDKILPLQI